MKRIIIILLAVLVVGAVTLDAKKPRKKSRSTASTVNLYQEDISGIFYAEEDGRTKVFEYWYAIWTDHEMSGRGDAGAQYMCSHDEEVSVYDGMITGKNTIDFYNPDGSGGELVESVVILSKDRIKINGLTYKRVADFQDLKEYLEQ